MTEEEARGWIEDNVDVSRETMARLERYIALLLAEADQQNLIAASTRDQLWTRHITDSAQLLKLAPDPEAGGWIDLGSGAGLPGMIVGILSGWRVTLIDSRRKRVEFLQAVIDDLGLDNVCAVTSRTETHVISPAAAVLSARAFAPLPRIFASAAHLADKNSFWLLPKGKSWQDDLETAKAQWHGRFHVEHSVTDPDSAIVVARAVRKRDRL